MRLSHLVFMLVGIFDVVMSYGKTGHSLIGKGSQSILSPEAESAIETYGILKEFDGDLGYASLWADSIKSKPRYRWTSPMHYGHPSEDEDPANNCSYYASPIQMIKTANMHKSIFRYNEQMFIAHNKGSCDYRFAF